MKKILKRILPILLAFTLLFGCCITSHAEETEYNVLELVQQFHDEFGEYETVFMCVPSSYMSSGTLFIYAYEDAYELRAVKYSGDSYYTIDCSGFSQFQLVDGVWTDVSASDSLKKYVEAHVNGYAYIYYSSCDIYLNLTGTDIFFQLTPLPTPIQLAVETIPTLVTQNLQVILIIAIACLASLVTLSVLRKKLPIFLRL